MGGGTPSTVDSGSLADFIGACLGSFDFTGASGRDPEVTMEVNPKTVNRSMLERLKRAGVNRLSIGVQSFSDAMLKTIGRKHSARDCQQAVGDARDAGFENISLDLMYGLPGQDLEDWRESLRAAVDFEPEHLSVYELTVEEDTVFGDRLQQGTLVLPAEETVLAMFEQARDFLSAKNYLHYEISNYSRKGFQGDHNINYWENGSYLGLGSGAVSCFSGVRVRNVEEPERFIEMITGRQKPFNEAEFLSIHARFRETVIMGLRMVAGVSIGLLEKRFGIKPENYYGETLQTLFDQELVEIKGNRLRLTERGLLLANRVMAQLV
jgi:oxygen-independent coproporphyrinogen-3 oxidase